MCNVPFFNFIIIRIIFFIFIIISSHIIVVIIINIMITVVFRGDLSVEQTPSTTYCILFHTGIVWCKSSVVYTVMCYTDYTAWPFDIQYCDVQLGSWAHDSTVLNLTIKGTNWVQIKFLL